MESTTRFTHHRSPFCQLLHGLGALLPSALPPGESEEETGQELPREILQCVLLLFFLNSYCTYFVLTLEATEWGSPRNLSDAVTSLQEYFTFKILGFTSVTSTLLLAITPGIIINPEENTGNIFPS